MDYQVTHIDGVPARWIEHGQGTARRLPPRHSDGRHHDLSLSAQADRLIAWLDAIDVEAPVLVRP